MESALERLGFASMDQVTPESLKKSFKDAVIASHPDRGGKEGEFDAILSSYVYLSTVLKRQSGGRNGLQAIVVEDVRLARDEQFVNELNNLVSDIFEHLDSTTHDSFRAEFNEQFEKVHVRDERGYGAWLQTHEEEKTVVVEDDFNRAFECAVTLGKPTYTALLLHPDEMAFVSGTTRGYQLIPTMGFTSEPEETPEYTDVQAAYTSDNTVFDKLPVYHEKTRTFEEILKEREISYQTDTDRDLEAIAAYEKRVADKEKEHAAHIASYFQSTASSTWALRSVRSVQHATPIGGQADSFIKEF